MLPLHLRIDRAQRLLQMLEQDAPLLALRVSELTPERQTSTKNYAAQLAVRARAELAALIEEKYFWDWTDAGPHAAD
ncbi:MAG: hypothetical protein ACRD2U_15865 [Terriglobales bacterium]